MCVYIYYRYVYISLRFTTVSTFCIVNLKSSYDATATLYGHIKEATKLVSKNNIFMSRYSCLSVSCGTRSGYYGMLQLS